ncbi:type III pantothenate kinase [Thioalkalivibrio sp.]|uniref:type III pantothenate kinase n=1 Tax=Thioalkalivibrio sp. TaxID=2093813 RepID=UPI00356601DC
MPEFLLFDLGSTSLKWQVRSETGLVLEEGRHDWTASVSASELPQCRPRAVWMVRVGMAEREESLRAALRARYGGVPVVSVHPRAEGPGGLRLDYDLQQFGADRYCALLGVVARTRKPAVIVDAGTAVTVDLLDEDGRHLGGYILPGLRGGLEAVNRLFTDALQTQVAPTLRLTGATLPADSAVLPAHDTGKALLHGWRLGLAGAVQRLGAEAGGAQQGVEWWLTGGDAGWLSTLLERPVHVVPGLVFDGLWCHLRPRRGKGGTA